MNTRIDRPGTLLFSAAPFLALATLGWCQAGEAVTRTFTIREPFGVVWGPDRVGYRVEFPEGAVTPGGVALKDVAGNPAAAQLSDITLWDDKETVKAATLSFMAVLRPGEKAEWTMTATRSPAQAVPTDLAIKEDGATMEVATAHVAIRLPRGTKTYEKPVAAVDLPAPVQGVRLRSGTWVGRGWWQTDKLCSAFSGTVLDKGPVFARVALRYEFVGGAAYSAVVELSAGQDVAIVTEEFNLGEGERYAMPELSGVKAGETFQYVKPHFASAKDALMWDWWAQTHGKVTAPHAYCFSLYEGLQPDSLEWAGRMYHEAAKPGDGGLACNADGRVISLNAYMQWGEDESLYAGAYNSKKPEEELAVIALRPGQWLHPDIDPHPVATLKQYCQTNNLWLERRTKPDFFLRAPVCLGRRVYGLGALERRERADDKGKPRMISDIILRHVRLGRLELNHVKDWTLDYAESAKYPRLFVEAGDIGGMLARYERNLKRKVQPDAKWVGDCLNSLRETSRAYATSDYGHMNYAINAGVLAHKADLVLASPQLTPDQAAEIRRHIAALVYNSLQPDYVPPRECGFAWGSANMMSQLRSRAALLAALLPGHPEFPQWSSYLAEWLTALAESQINARGATLEPSHYGSMALELPFVSLAALARSAGGTAFQAVGHGQDARATNGKVDLTRATELARAAARLRLAFLMPWDLRGGFRAPAPIGDAYYHGDGALAYLAAFLAPRDPELSKQLLWGLNESGRAFEGHPTPGGLMVDPDAQGSAPQLASEHFPGAGFIMRNGFPAKEEAWLAVNAGSYSVGHGHNDRGCFIYYAMGVPLCADFASMYTPSLRELWVHPGGLSFDHDESVRPCPGRDKEGCFYKGKVWEEHTIEPFTCLQPGWDPKAKDLDEAFGTVAAFTPLPAADFAEMTRVIRYLNRVPYMLPDPHKKLLTDDSRNDEVYAKQPVTWKRRFVFVKNADLSAPNYVVFRDDLGQGAGVAGQKEFKPALNLWCLADKLDVNGQVASYTGQFGVDLDCFVAEPSAFQHRTHTVQHPCGFGFEQYYKKTFGKPFVESQILLQVPLDQSTAGSFVVLVPRKHAAPPPKFSVLPGGHAVQIAWGERTDTVVLANRPEKIEAEGLALEGSAFVLTRSQGKLRVTMLAGGTARKGDKVLLGDGKSGTVETE